MKYKLIPTILLIFLLLSLGLIQGCHKEPSYKDLNGNIIHLSDFHSQWLLINYWAYWCKPCFQEIPELNAFSQKEHIPILGVSYDQGSDEDLKKWVTQLGIQ